jgi:hypothetical protein
MTVLQDPTALEPEFVRLNHSTLAQYNSKPALPHSFVVCCRTGYKANRFFVTVSNCINIVSFINPINAGYSPLIAKNFNRYAITLYFNENNLVVEIGG